MRHENSPPDSYLHWADGLGELVLPFLDGGGDTAYAPGFREDAFRSLPVGADLATAHRAVGAPLDQSRYGGETYWYYSRHGPRSKSYFLRILIFDQTEHLTHKLAYFYVD